MHLSALEENGLRRLLQVAARDAQGSFLVQEIARAEEFAPDCVARIPSQRNDAGLAQGARGPGGDPRLARAASEISACQAMTGLGGEIFPPGSCDCPPGHGQRRQCAHTAEDASRALGQKLQAVLHRVLDAIKLDEWRRDESLAAGCDRQAALLLYGQERLQQ